MQAFGWPRAAAVVPILAVASAAALLFLVALSIALQPPASTDVGSVSRAVEWARALLFSAGAAAFLVGMVAFARAGSGAGAAPAGALVGTDDVSGFATGERPPSPARHDEPPLQPRRTEDQPVRFTLIALGAGEDDPRAIVDFTDAVALIAAVRDWERQYPDEEVRIFGPDGTQLARRVPAPAPARRPARVGRPRSLEARVRLATGGA